MAFATGFHRKWIHDQGIIVLFHRVDDKLGDNPITCTQAAFTEYCDFFQLHFDVIALSELISALEAGESLAGKLAITFDDGYYDNEAIAATELRARNLPCCFFIATEFIESEHLPWWDANQSIQSNWMSWDQVRSLHQQGFEIGAHTMNHLDLSEVDPDTVDREITGSKKRLERELLEEIPLFSYPYGLRHQVKESARNKVRDAGFLWGLSAFGGLVKPSTDSYNIPRIPVSPYYISPYHFAFETLRD